MIRFASNTFRRRTSALALLLVAAAAPNALAVVGTGPIFIDDTSAITHNPNALVGDGAVTPSVTTSKFYTSIGDLNGVATLDLGAVPSTGSVYTDSTAPKTGTSIAKGGFDHKTVTGLGGAVGLTITGGTGVTQTDGGAFGGNASTLTINTALQWDISDGWTGPISVYQSLLVALKTSGAGDIASVTGTFTYNVDLNTVTSPGIDLTKTITYSVTQQDINATKNKTLYAGGVLSAASIPAAANGAGDKNIITLSALITFTAKDPAGSVGIDNIDDPIALINSLGSLVQFDVQGGLTPEEAQQFLGTLGGGVGTFHAAELNDHVIDVIPSPSTLALGLLAFPALFRRRARR